MVNDEVKVLLEKGLTDSALQRLHDHPELGRSPLESDFLDDDEEAARNNRRAQRKQREGDREYVSPYRGRKNIGPYND
jgi:hypothetical protein